VGSFSFLSPCGADYGASTFDDVGGELGEWPRVPTGQAPLLRRTVLSSSDLRWYSRRARAPPGLGHSLKTHSIPRPDRGGVILAAESFSPGSSRPPPRRSDEGAPTPVAQSRMAVGGNGSWVWRSRAGESASAGPGAVLRGDGRRPHTLGPRRSDARGLLARNRGDIRIARGFRVGWPGCSTYAKTHVRSINLVVGRFCWRGWGADHHQQSIAAVQKTGFRDACEPSAGAGCDSMS